MLDQSAGIPKRAHRGAMRSEIWEMVRAWGLEPQRLAAREPKGDVTLVKDFQSPPYHKGRASFPTLQKIFRSRPAEYLLNHSTL